jgi:hypothetical protein
LIPIGIGSRAILVRQLSQSGIANTSSGSAPHD